MTEPLSTAHFAELVTLEVIAVGLLAIAIVAGLIWLYDYVRDRWIR